EVPRENVSGERRLHLRIAQRELGLTLHGFGSIYRCERRIKTGLRKVIIWLGQTLCGIECFRPAEVLFRLRVLCNCRVDLRTGFIRLIRQVLTTYFGQYRSLRVVIPGANVPSTTIGRLDLLYSGNVTGSPKSDIDLRIRTERRGRPQAFGGIVKSHIR